MKKHLRVLVVDDSEEHASAVLRQLHLAGYGSRFVRVQTKAQMTKALDRDGWDLVISDYRLGAFSAAEAAGVLGERGLDAPLIVVSEESNRERAVACIRAGAHDYITDEQMGQLPGAVERELREAVERRQRRAAEEGVRRTEAQYLTLARNLPDTAVLMYDKDLRFVVAEGLSLAQHDAFQMEIEGRMIRSVFHEAADADIVAHCEGALSGTEAILERGLDGRVFNVHILPVKNDEGEVIAGMLVWHDITERKQAMEALRVSEERFRLAAECATDLIYEWDLASGDIEWLGNVNGATGTDHGGLPRTQEERRQTIHPDDRERVDAALRRHLATGEAFREEYRVVRPDGEALHWTDTGTALFDERGEAVKLIGAITDVTDQVTMEQALRQSQKMEALGRLAGGVAHDFNNLLTAITGYTALIKRGLDDRDPTRRGIEEIGKAAERAAGLTGQLLAFSRRQRAKPERLDLNSVVANMGNMLRRVIAEDVELAIVEGEDLGAIKADRGLMEQVIMNLAVNARDAMPGGGKLCVETSNAHIRSVSESQLSGVAPGSYVVLSIRDTGCGMNEDVQSRIFEPFFTTKAQGEGTGLGLSTVYGIVTQAGGAIRVSSTPEKGSAFAVYLPMAGQEEEEEAPESEDETELPAGTETVLLAEDERMVRSLVQRVLEAQGFTVIEAANGREALAAAEKHHDGIHLILTDVVMPEMSGRELVEELAPLRPETKVLYMSGYTDSAIVQHGVLDSERAFIQKPFTPETLLAKVFEVLRGTGGE